MTQGEESTTQTLQGEYITKVMAQRAPGIACWISDLSVATYLCFLWTTGARGVIWIGTNFSLFFSFLNNPGLLLSIETSVLSASWKNSSNEYDNRYVILKEDFYLTLYYSDSVLYCIRPIWLTIFWNTTAFQIVPGNLVCLTWFCT